jgi:putative flippase GtrA
MEEGSGTGRLFRRLLRDRFVRFLLVGGLNMVFGYSVFAGGILLGLPYPVAALISTCVGILFNFKSYGILVFGSHDNRLIFRFLAVYGTCYVLGLAVLAWGQAHGLSPLLVAAVYTVPMAAFAYALQRVLVFRPASRLRRSGISGR